MSNRIPRVTVKLQENGRGGYWATFSPWVVDHLNAEKGSDLHPSVWRKGDQIVLEQDAVLFEVVRDARAV